MERENKKRESRRAYKEIEKAIKNIWIKRERVDTTIAPVDANVIRPQNTPCVKNIWVCPIIMLRSDLCSHFVWVWFDTTLPANLQCGIPTRTDD